MGHRGPGKSTFHSEGVSEPPSGRKVCEPLSAEPPCRGCHGLSSVRLRLRVGSPSSPAIRDGAGPLRHRIPTRLPRFAVASKSNRKRAVVPRKKGEQQQAGSRQAASLGTVFRPGSSYFFSFRDLKGSTPPHSMRPVPMSPSDCENST